MQLTHLGKRVHCLSGITQVGVIDVGDGEAILIDTGMGDRSGRQILRALESHDLTPTAILNTHGHGDHTGGNAYIVERTDARLYAPTMDKVIIEDPNWGIGCLFMGADPLPELQIARYMPRPCPVDMTVAEGPFAVNGITVQAIPLPGHTGSHTGYVVDGVFFTGDAVAAPQELDKVSIPYMYSIHQQLASLRRIPQVPCEGYVMSHGGYADEIEPIVARNIAQIEAVLDFIVARVTEGPTESNDLLPLVCDEFNLCPRHIRDYLFLYSTLHAYLGELVATERLTYELADTRLYWRAV